MNNTIVISENMQYSIKCINELYKHYNTDYSININDYLSVDDCKKDCKIAIDELFQEGYFDFNFKLFLLDMLK